METAFVVALIIFAGMVVMFGLGFALTYYVNPERSEPPVIPAVPNPKPIVEFRPAPPQVTTIGPKKPLETVIVHLQNERGTWIGDIKLHKIRRKPSFQYRTPKDGKLGVFMCVDSLNDSEFTYRRVSVERE